MRIDAWGKHLFYHFSRDGVLHIHLGLYGRFRVHDNPPPKPRSTTRLRMKTAKHTIDLSGPIICEVISEDAVKDVIDRLGADPLRRNSHSADAWTRIHKSCAPAGQLIMDQSIIAGVGNIYRTELLWLIKLHPLRPGNEMTRRQFNVLWKDAVELMKLAVKHGMIITIDLKASNKPAGKLRSTQRFNIFNKPKCPRCGGAVTKFAIQGRRVFACETCQPPLRRR